MILNWQNHNRYIAYPFKEDTNLVDVSTLLTIPNNFLLDFFATYYEAAEAGIVLKTIEVDGGGASLTVTFLIDNVQPAVIVIPAAAADPFESEFVIQSGSSSTVRLNPVFGAGALEIMQTPAYQGNTYTFTAVVEPSTIATPYKHSLTKLIAKNIDINDNETTLPDIGEGDIKFIEGYNVIIRTNEDTFNITAAVGAGAGVPCEPVYGAIDCGCGIYYINGKHPDWLGNFKFEGGKRIVVTTFPSENKIKIKTSIRNGTPTCQDPADDPGRLPSDVCVVDPLPAVLPLTFCEDN